MLLLYLYIYQSKQCSLPLWVWVYDVPRYNYSSLPIITISKRLLNFTYISHIYMKGYCRF